MVEQIKPSLPIPVQRALRKLGGDIRTARLRRRISTNTPSDRAAISRTTLNKVEKGEPSVAMWIYATVLFVLGLNDKLAKLAEPAEDTVGLLLEEENLPQRIHSVSIAGKGKNGKIKLKSEKESNKRRKE